MPKVKTNSSAKKRFSITGSGKIKRKHAFKSHILTKMSTKRKRNLTKAGLVSDADMNNVKYLLKIWSFLLTRPQASSFRLFETPHAKNNWRNAKISKFSCVKSAQKKSSETSQRLFRKKKKCLDRCEKCGWKRFSVSIPWPQTAQMCFSRFVDYAYQCWSTSIRSFIFCIHGQIAQKWNWIKP